MQSVSILTAHMIVRNEEQWVWYAINSVLPYVAKLLIYDTGSTDQTVSIIKSIKSRKIRFEEKGLVTPAQLVDLRNEQIKRTDTAWFILLDGDEVWPQKTIEELREVIYRKGQTMAVVVKALIPVGDLFHFQPPSAGRYKLLGKVGHFNIRAYRVHPHYSWQGTYPLEAYTNKSGIPIQEMSSELKLIKSPYWHLTHLTRSTRDVHGRRKLELGVKKRVHIPEVFLRDRPEFVPSPWVKFTGKEKLLAAILTPIRGIKRRWLRGN